MADQHWERLEELFEQARAMPIDARAAFLERGCAGDPVLRAEVQALLGADETARALSVERLVVDEPRADVTNDWRLGERLGPWRLGRVVGSGGMGVVHGASRDDGQYQLDVAVKLMRAGFRDPQAIDRFRIERQLLASLKHPNIAGLIDGGLAPDGQPYFVMELVDGIPITDWCRGRRLSLRARLELFRTVCDAVQHAHRALVVHRDLKPANILVSSAGEVTLLDFGIAKVLDPPAWGLGGGDTMVEMRALSPDYVAPEQREGGAITTGTDVYALGVVLYELIAGERPLSQDKPGSEGRGQGAPTTLTPPSEAIRRSRNDSAAGSDGAAAGAADRRRLARRVHGDLDRITLTALRDDPARRYPSAGQLSEEIGRFLSGRAVLAQPDTLGYRAHKFVGRNAVAVGLGTIFVVGLATFGVLSAWQARVRWPASACRPAPAAPGRRTWRHHRRTGPT
jgi:serine/threonine protein kinase